MDGVSTLYHSPITPRLAPTTDFFGFEFVPALDLETELFEGSGVASVVETSMIEGMEVNFDHYTDHVPVEEDSVMPQYYRVDELWDNFIHDYKLVETPATKDIQDHGDYAFYVRRRFDRDGRYQETMVDIKSRILRDILRTALASCTAISLYGVTPAVDPNMLFLYFENLQKQYKEIELEAASRVEDCKETAVRATQLKSLLEYIESDYSEIKKTLDSLLNAGCITFDLLWSLFRPNEIIYTSTYTAIDEARAFKVKSISKDSSPLNGTWYEIQGEYVDFNGHIFGFSDIAIEINYFKGTRRITSLPCYPMTYHRNSKSIERQLISRGRKFVELAGMKYKSCTGLGFTKINNEIIMVPITSRVMIDPEGFHQANPDYSTWTAKSASPTEHKDSLDYENENDAYLQDHNKASQGFTKYFTSSSSEALAQFTDRELLIASPLVPGFVFSKKIWLELPVDGIQDVRWSENAFELLVLPNNQKSMVKALVESYDSASKSGRTTDDFISGKGGGLVTLLHGPPGVAKTLTAESIAELLRRPLYHISMAELGTDPRHLEQGLVKISDLAHRWGAVLLLDEADVFLEARAMQDVHRNALVSVFLRMLAYFCGILFLTTNRVTSFDHAFQSRIHMALRVSRTLLGRVCSAS